MNKSSIKVSAAILCLFTCFSAQAQREIIQKAIDKSQSTKNISYTVVESGNDPFGGSDYKNEAKVTLYNRQTNGSYERFNIFRGKKFHYLDDGKQYLELNFVDSTYLLTPSHKVDTVNGSLATAIQSIRHEFKMNSKISLLADTMMNRQACYHILLNRGSNTDKSYTYCHIFISKSSNLIQGFSSSMQGEMFKGGLSLGLIKMTQTYSFSNYQLNNKPAPAIDFTIPAGLTIEEKPKDPLAKGTPAPNWSLTATDGKKLSLADLKGKVVFINFCSNGCAAAALSVPSMKALNSKYDGTDVAVLTINTYDSKDEILKYMNKQDIKAPVYLNGKSAAKTYNVAGDPNFYLVDKEGRINWASRGYFEDFDNTVIAKIEALR